MNNDEHTLDLILASDPSKLDWLVNKVEAFLQERIDDEEFIYQVVLLTSESVTNGMEHGNEFDADKKVFVSLRVFTTYVQLRVSDEGAGFDRADVVDPLKEDSLMLDGGRGLFLIEQMADSVVYEDGGRTVIMRIKRS
ncbi:MAG: ATP-binding protein [Rhodothermales bacterium]|nr:ATP-binding protein [Rhodothermales bacterium]